MPKRSPKPSAANGAGLDDFLRRFPPALLGGVLVAALVLAYGAIWWAGYIWDDESMVVANPVIAGPLGLREIWTTNNADICPLTLSTFWLEFHLWGSTPLPYHLVTLALHAICALMLWRVLSALRIPGAWLGAAIWALHPVQVESVAWISEMKNTESGLFFLLRARHAGEIVDGHPAGGLRALRLVDRGPAALAPAAAPDPGRRHVGADGGCLHLDAASFR
jgi:hypothetical protein